MLKKMDTTEDISTTCDYENLKRKGVVAMSIKNFQENTFSPKEMFLYPWLQKQGLAMLYGVRGTGKTFLALSIACTVASGASLGIWKAPKKRKVLYIDGEMPGIEIQDRLSEIIQENINIDLMIVTPDIQLDGMPDLSTLDGQDRLSDYVENAEFIIVDNISTLCRTGRENESESWKQVQEWALFQRSRGKTILFVHHAGKSGSQRGNSSKEDVLDTVISLKNSKNYSPSMGVNFELHFEKNRSFYGEEAMPLNLSYNKGKWNFSKLANSTYFQVVELSKKGIRNNDIAETLSINKGTVSKYLTKAKNDGLLPVATT